MTYSSKELERKNVPQYAQEIRKWRRSHLNERGKPIRQYEMAAMVGIDPATLASIELGRASPTKRTLDKIDNFIARWSKVPQAAE